MRTFIFRTFAPFITALRLSRKAVPLSAARSPPDISR